MSNSNSLFSFNKAKQDYHSYQQARAANSEFLIFHTISSNTSILQVLYPYDLKLPLFQVV
ncbi:hypothetical protein B9J82_03145 [Vibrio sp. V10_P2A27P122]|nr:hypothetical protein B9J82_03145 [Vibrio sp. V10_P2A27P122]